MGYLAAVKPVLKDEIKRLTGELLAPTRKSAVSSPATLSANLAPAARKGVDRRADRRQKGGVKVGVENPWPLGNQSHYGGVQGHWRPIILTAIFTGLHASEFEGCAGPTWIIKER
jgi:integrase